jgi:hypothetical protein
VYHVHDTLRLHGELVQVQSHLPSAAKSLAAALTLIILTAAPAFAHVFSEMTGPFRPRIPLIGRILDSNIPGLANPLSPLVLPPCFQGEVKARPIFELVTEQTFRAPKLGAVLDLEKDLGFDDQFTIVEVMVRAQIASLSVRADYESPLSTSRSGLGHLDWPPFRMGLDLDLLDCRTCRIGVNGDVYWERPGLSVILPIIGSRFITWNRPITAGIHVAFNPPGWGGLAPSFDSRVRWPLTQNSRLTEFEIAGGLRTPQTVLGSTAVRGGWRYTRIELRNSDPSELDFTWSGIFGELVYFY